MRVKHIDIIHRLIELRTERGLTQEDVARRINSYKSNICRIEQEIHSPSIGTLQQYAKGIGVELTIEIVE